MKRFANYIRNIASGNIAITNHFKYSFVIVSVTVVHFFFMLFFAYENIFPLIIYNLLSVILYASSYQFIQNRKYIQIYFMAFTEITIHSILTTCFVGWSLGFSLYLFVLVPVGFYMTYTLHRIKHRLQFCSLMSLFLCIAYSSCYLLTKHFTPPYKLINHSHANFMYVFNASITFFMLLFFTILFSIEIQVNQAALVQENKKLDEAANFDPLTSLFNRRSMQHFLLDAMESRDEFCLIMCDIDDFKLVNDTYSHDCGDLVLKKISKIIQDSIREGDYACRWGGEEILILTSSASLQCARNIAERIRENVEKSHVSYGKKNIRYTMTLGIAKKTPLRTDVKEIINSADENLYIGKKKGKNCVVG